MRRRRRVAPGRARGARRARSAVRRSSRERPEPSASRTPASGTPRSASTRARRPRRRRRVVPACRCSGAELLQEHLGDRSCRSRRFIALDDAHERRRVDVGEAGGGSLDLRLGHAAHDVHADLLERRAERLRGHERRVVDRAAVHLAAADDERRERRALLLVVRRLPARRRPLRVEEVLVRDDAARDEPDPAGLDLAREERQVVPRERRVAVALEDEPAAPDGSVLLALAVDARRDAVARPELARARRVRPRASRSTPGRSARPAFRAYTTLPVFRSRHDRRGRATRPDELSARRDPRLDRRARGRRGEREERQHGDEHRGQAARNQDLRALRIGRSAHGEPRATLR